MKVGKEFKGAFHITFTIDCWTDDFQHNNYVTITAHFIDSSWRLRSFVLCTEIMEGSVTGEALSEKLEKARRKFGLTETTFTMVSDQGANILRAGRISDWHHVTCFAHKLNLCLTKNGLDATPGWSSLLKKCKDIVCEFRFKSQDVRNKQKELLDFMENVVEDDHNYYNITFEVGTTSLKRPIKTRWNSICTMVESIVENKSVIEDLLRDYGKANLIFRTSEMTALKMLLEFLQPFKLVTNRLQADLYPTISQIWPCVSLLKKKCQVDEEKEGEAPQQPNE